ncbi:MAG TPA: helix-turn-helix transcriptional regulator [Pirellulaceae bacterium]|nr:helix-turn-helix transcriptional regulator [Planctomycetales bacterium]MCB9936806.1 helix-turn-helix transcriptional regulator [Planctomycetaceae bacterium]HRX78734.1 helix-turn-helix transcriptional regulator [Pirellulaceae bacterium]
MKTVDCLLEDANWAVEDLAERANLTNDRAEAIALGRWTPSPSERQRIAAAFEVSMEDVSWGHTMDPRNVRYRRFGFKDVNDDDRGSKSATPG